ncbi:MAG: hypothetical protein GX301_05775 [Gracilibacteraceae bacterium]|nr:hypothetical protein [Gracilibacteraceae bacterium]
MKYERIFFTGYSGQCDRLRNKKEKVGDNTLRSISGAFISIQYRNRIVNKTYRIRFFIKKYL